MTTSIAASMTPSRRDDRGPVKVHDMLGRRLFILFWTLLALVGLQIGHSEAGLAHRSGCHAAHSCESDTGSYICGDTGHSNFCDGSSSASPVTDATGQAPPPRKPQSAAAGATHTRDGMANTGPSAAIWTTAALGLVLAGLGTRLRGPRAVGQHFR